MKITCCMGMGYLWPFLFKISFTFFLGIYLYPQSLQAQSFVYYWEGSTLEIDVFYDSSVPISELMLTIPVPEGYVVHPESNPQTLWTPGWFCPAKNCSDEYTLLAWKKEFYLIVQNPEAVMGTGRLLRVKGIITEVEDVILRQGQVKNAELLLYPNPGSGKYILEFPNVGEYLLQSEWYDLQGRVVARFDSRTGTSVLQSRELPAGAYMVQIKSNRAIYQKRVIKN